MFTSRSGYKIEEYHNGGLYIGHRHGLSPVLTAAEADALRDFFQHELDEELGRWRWPENQDYVVYPVETIRGQVVAVSVLNEVYGETVQYPRANTVFYSGEGKAARAYFDAHPESEPKPKPWHDAKPGEVWEVTHEDGRSLEMTCVMDGINLSFFNSSRLHTVHYTGIRDARRIWPEDK